MDLKTNYMGLSLKSPLAVAASPLSEKVDSIKKMEDVGASAVVLYSVFEEQIKMEQKDLDFHMTEGADSFSESSSFFPEPSEYRMGTEEYLEHIANAKKAVDIPIIASINGNSLGGWTGYAKSMQEAGADAIELNVYNIPTDMEQSGADIEKNYVDILKAVKSAVSIPVAMKLSPYFSNMANMAKQLDEAGADALVMFNRFYQPDIDLEELVVNPNVLLSNSQAMRLPMRWIAILKDRIKADLGATSGIQTGADVIKMMMVGANAAFINSSILKRGIEHIGTIKSEIERWMEKKEYDSIQQMQGSMSQMKNPDPSAYERAQYMKALTSYKVY